MSLLWLENAINKIGRSLEFALTGQSHFRIRLNCDTINAQLISDSSRANLARDEVRTHLRNLFGIDHAWPILIDLQQPPPRGWRASFYNPDGNLGRYSLKELRGHPAHEILVAPGLPRMRFCSLLAHELTHAFQRERNILINNQALREGMARWVEWHFLKHYNDPGAQRLLKIRHYTFGRSIETILEFERKQNRHKTVEWLCTQ